ncbi:MAG: sugar transferase [Thermoleophilia bacterium]|nr:sugar transferase [Thermoleophilia bacterium]
MDEPGAGHVLVGGPSAEGGGLLAEQPRGPVQAERPQPERKVAWGRFRLAVDAALIAAAVIASEVAWPAGGVPPAAMPWPAALPVLTFVFLWARGAYRVRRTLHVLDEVRLAASVAAVAGMTVITLRVVLTNDAYVAAQTIRAWGFIVIYLVAARVTLAWAYTRAARRGELGHPALIIGAGHVGHLTAKRLLERPELGLRPIGFLDKEPLAGDGMVDLPVLGASWDFDDVARRFRVEHVIVTFSTAPHSVLLRLVKRCDELDIPVSVVPRLFEKVTERVTVEHIGGLPLVTIHPADPKGWQFAVKYATDRAVAALALLLTSPLILARSLAVRVSMGAPVFYRQLRVGRDGRVFEIVKFRSMRPQPAGETLDAGVLLGAESDPSLVADEQRLTRVGAFLRRTSLDELPQLVNVLRGDMSIVGPRPERPELVDLFEQSIYRYEERHRVKSGITGWAQVHGIGRGENRFGETTLAERVEWDNYYIENWSLWLDIKILVLTVGAVLRFRQPT